MGSIKRFEDIEAWQRARGMASQCYAVTNRGAFSRDFGLRDQIRRAAVSVMANIAEGFGRRSHKEFAQFLHVAKASCVEVQSHLYVALDQGYVTQDQFTELRQGYLDTQSMLVNFIKYLERSTRAKD